MRKFKGNFDNIRYLQGNPDKVIDISPRTRYDEYFLTYRYTQNKEGERYPLFCKSMKDLYENKYQSILVDVTVEGDEKGKIEEETRIIVLNGLDLILDIDVLEEIMTIPELSGGRRRYIDYNIPRSYHAMGLSLPGFPIGDLMRGNKNKESVIRDYSSFVFERGSSDKIDELAERLYGFSSQVTYSIRSAKMEENIRKRVATFVEGIVERKRPDKRILSAWYDLMDIAWGNGSIMFSDSNIHVGLKSPKSRRFVFQDHEGIERDFYQRAFDTMPKLVPGLNAHLTYKMDITVKWSFMRALLEKAEEVIEDQKWKMREELFNRLSGNPGEIKRYIKQLIYAEAAQDTIADKTFGRLQN